MGTIGAPIPAAKLIAEETASCTIVRKAWGGNEDGRRTCWLHLKHNENGREFLAVALVSSEKRYDATWNYVKIVTEDMGPSAIDVPDKVWNGRPATPDSEYAASWRERVEKYRTTYPHLVTELTAADVGRKITLEGGTTVEFAGFTQVGRKSTAPYFLFPHAGRARIRNWRHTRYAVAEAVAA